MFLGGVVPIPCTMSNTLSWQNLNYSVGKTNYTVKWDPFRVAKETNLRRILNNGKVNCK